MLPYRYRPSVGFILVCLVYGLTAVFFLWGALRPDLDRIWFLQHELRTGVRKDLDGRDRKLLLEAMTEHPALCQSLCDGGTAVISAHTNGFLETSTAYIARAPGSPGASLTLRVSPAEPGTADKIKVRGFGPNGPLAATKITPDERGSFRIPLKDAQHPELWEIRWRPDADGEDAPPTLRLVLGEDK